MEFIDLDKLERNVSTIRTAFQRASPFRYVIIEDFFNAEKAEQILLNYPSVHQDRWDGTTYLDQQNKFQQTVFDPGSWMECVFSELNSQAFLLWLQRVTGIEDLLADETLLGGGLHQSTTGAFLNVHVDYNIHLNTKLHRRLNVLIYMNKDWQDAYEGHLELWDFTGKTPIRIDRIAPTFNRCVIFETNEISYHGHPKPLNTPPDVTRKSIATYYYTQSRPLTEIVPEHNTLYVNTEGKRGQIRRLGSGLKALVERLSRRT